MRLKARGCWADCRWGLGPGCRRQGHAPRLQWQSCQRAISAVPGCCVPWTTSPTAPQGAAWLPPTHSHNLRSSHVSTAGIAWYIAAADVINEQYKRVSGMVLPLRLHCSCLRWCRAAAAGVISEKHKRAKRRCTLAADEAAAAAAVAAAELCGRCFPAAAAAIVTTAAAPLHVMKELYHALPPRAPPCSCPIALLLCSPTPYSLPLSLSSLFPHRRPCCPSASGTWASPCPRASSASCPRCAALCK